MTDSDAPRPLDKIDRKILALLQANGRLSATELAHSVNLTLTPCLERVRRLESDGFIEGYVACLNPKLLGQGLVAFTEVTLDHTTPDAFDRFRDAIRLVEEVAECHMVAGGFDYLLKVRVRDLEEYRRVMGEKIVAIAGVRHAQTYLVMESVKSSHMLRIPEPRREASTRRRVRR